MFEAKRDFYTTLDRDRRRAGGVVATSALS
jgi:hypothetical protein